MKRASQLQELETLRSEIDRGLADIAEGRVKDFDVDRIIARGRQILAQSHVTSKDLERAYREAALDEAAEAEAKEWIGD